MPATVSYTHLESLATSLTYQSALAIFILLIDIEVIEVVAVSYTHLGKDHQKQES